MPTNTSELGFQVKRKYPKVFDTLSDRDTGRIVKDKFPDRYSHITDDDTPGMEALGGQPPIPNFPKIEMQEVERFPEISKATQFAGDTIKQIPGEIAQYPKQLASGLYQSAASGANTLDAANKLLGKLAGIPPETPGPGWHDAPARARDYYTQKANEYSGGRDDLGSKVLRGIGAAPGEVAKIMAASSMLGGPALGMGALGALEGSQEGPTKALTEGLKGAALGKSLHYINQLAPIQRGVTSSALFGGLAAAEGSPDWPEAALVGAGLSATAGKGGKSMADLTRGPAPITVSPNRFPASDFQEPAPEPPTVRPPESSMLPPGMGVSPLQSPMQPAKGKRLTRPVRVTPGELPPTAPAPTNITPLVPTPLASEAPKITPPDPMLPPPGTGPIPLTPPTVKSKRLSRPVQVTPGEPLPPVLPPNTEPLVPSTPTIAPPVQPKPKPFGSEKGAITISPPTPRTPGEIIADENLSRREQARKSSNPSFPERLSSLGSSLKEKLVESYTPILDRFSRGQSEGNYTLLESQNFGDAIDRVARSRAAGAVAAREAGLESLVRSFPTGQDVLRFDEYLQAKARQDIHQRKGTPYHLLSGVPQTEGLLQQQRDATLVSEFDPRYAPKAQQVRDASSKVLDIGVHFGLLDPAEVANLKKDFYVPLERISSIITASKARVPTPTTSGPSPAASLPGQHVVQPLTGIEAKPGQYFPSEGALQSVLSSFERVYMEGTRNEAARILANAHGYGPSGAKSPPLPGFEDALEVNPSIDAPNVIKWLDSGKPRAIQVAPEVAAAAKSLNKVQLQGIEKIAAAALRVSKVGIVGLNLPFLVSNLAVDGITSLIQADVPISTQAKHLVPSFKQALLQKTDPLTKAGAGVTSFEYLRNTPAATINRMRALRSPQDALGYVAGHPIHAAGDLWRALENLAASSEMAGRTRVFNATYETELSRGRTPEDATRLAARASNNQLPNYTRHGSYGPALNAAFLFLNAGIQGSRSRLSAIQDRPGQTLLRMAISVAFPAVLASLWNLQEEKRRAAYYNIDPEERTKNFLLIPDNPPPPNARGSQDVTLKLKVPPGMDQSIYTATTELMEKLLDDDPMSFQRLAEAFIGTASPISTTRELGSHVPDLIKPEFQQLINKNLFTGRDIVSDSMSRAPRELRAHPWTSGTAHLASGAITKGLQSLGSSAEVAPVQVDQYIRDRFGPLGSQALNLTDRALTATGTLQPSQIGSEDPFTAVQRRFTQARAGETQRAEREDLTKLQSTLSSQISLSPESQQELIRLRILPGFPAKQPYETPDEYLTRSKVRYALIDQVMKAYKSDPTYTSLPQDQQKSRAREGLRELTGKLNSRLQDETYQSLQPAQRLQFWQGILNSLQQPVQ